MLLDLLHTLLEGLVDVGISSLTDCCESVLGERFMTLAALEVSAVEASTGTDDALAPSPVGVVGAFLFTPRALPEVISSEDFTETTPSAFSSSGAFLI